MKRETKCGKNIVEFLELVDVGKFPRYAPGKGKKFRKGKCFKLKKKKEKDNVKN